MTPLPSPQAHVAAARRGLDSLDQQLATLQRWGGQLASALSEGHRLLAAGNGGSAAQAQHLTAELVGRYRDDRAPFSAIPLHADTSSFSAILNDYGPEDVYARQVQAHGRPGDVLVLLSTSGRSPNLLAAVKAAHDEHMRVWAYTGPRPNPLADAADEAVVIDAPNPAVQEAHLVGLHVLCGVFDVCLTMRRR